MSEDEYIKTLRDVATRYIEFVRKPDITNEYHAHHWRSVKEKISPFTMIKLCDHWMSTGAVFKEDADLTEPE